MRKIVAYPFSIIYYFNMFMLLLVFHPFQIIAYHLFGYQAHKKVVDILSYCLILNLYTLLCRPVFKGFDKLPVNQPLIVISNHQSMFDISPIVVGFRKHHIKFISKMELGKYLPSVSYNLRKGGSILIDRDNRSQSIKEIMAFGERMEERNFSVCIFPEGTRSKTGEVKQFRLGGLKTLFQAAPKAIIVPMVIDGNYKLHRYGMFPLNIGLRLTYTALAPLNRTGLTDEALIEHAEQQIKEQLINK